MASLPYPTLISQSSSRQLKQNIITSNYGDNVTQIAAWGVNSQWEEWSLEWNALTQVQRDAWMAFYATVGLYNVFYWAAPGGAVGAWRFTEGPVETSSGWYYNISAKVRYFPDAIATP